MFEIVETTHHRLERYVVGVLWGEGFRRKDYFASEELAMLARKNIQESDKDSESADHVYKNIGSRVDFLQLVKSLVNDSSIDVKYYNEDLANVVANVSDTEIIQSQVIEDFRKLAQKTNDAKVLSTIDEFERQMEQLRQEKENAERKAEEEHQHAEEERRKAEEAHKRADEEKQKRERAEMDLNAQKQQNLYLNNNREVSQEIEDLMHTVLISSTELSSLVTSQKVLLEDDIVNKSLLADLTRDIDFNVERIHTLSSLITKADVALLRESTDVDIWAYSKEFLSSFERTLKLNFESDESKSYVKKVPILELSIILQNLVSNSRKANATQVLVRISKQNRTIIMDFSDNGDGVDLSKLTAESIFEVGVTNRKGGSGIGLHTIREQMRKDLNGDITFVNNEINGYKGATFRLIFM